MSSASSKQMCCLICGQVQPKNSFLAHISEHFNYRQHKCQDCDFESVTVEEMADHESATEHMGQLYALRNQYMDRVCRFIYNDCDYGEKNGGLEKVLKRKLASANDEEGGGGGQQLNQQNNAAKIAAIFGGIPSSSSSSAMFMKAEESALPSPKTSTADQQQQPMVAPPASIIDHHRHHHSAPSFAALAHQQQWTDPAINSSIPEQSSANPVAQNVFAAIKMDLMGSQHYQMGGGHVQSEFPCADANYLVEQAMMEANGSSGGTCSSSTDDIQQQQSVLEKFIAEQHQQIRGEQMLLFQQGGEGDHPPVGHHRYHDDDDDGPASPQHPTQQNKKKYKEVFEDVQCLKCGQFVKGRGICLLYHINTRHLKLPLYRCLACPRDFFYVTDTTAKNHIRSFHGNDLSLLENNYSALSKILHNSRREFYGPSKSERKAGLKRAKKAAAMSLAAKRLKEGKKKAGGGEMVQRQRAVKEINFRERPQAGSGTAGNSSHVQCNQCGEFVATIYSSQLSHINTKHLHLPVYECKLCERTFEALSTSAAIIHIKSMHGKGKGEVEAQIVDRRDECLAQLNECYRAYFA